LTTRRILQVIETGGPGGAETVFARLSSGLSAQGHTVHCVIRDGSWLPGELKRRGLPFSFFPPGGSFNVAAVKELRALIRAQRIDVVHAHLFDGAVYASMAARSLGVPCVVTLHGQVDVARRNWRMALKHRVFAACVDRVALVSDALRRDLSGELRMSARQQVVVHNGVPLPPSPAETRAAWRTSGSREDGVKRVLAIGNIRAPKNYPLLLEALAGVRTALPNVALHIAGEPDRGGLQQQLEQQVRQLGLEDAVTFHGFVADPSTLLDEADVFVLASSQEGFSLATIEAMLHGVPVVCTRSGGPEEIVRDGDTGVLVPVNDASALRDALLAVLRDHDGSRAMAERGRADAAARFSLAHMVARYETLYDEVIASR
jgi:glycosyltransferase involved in cell wall biosynthesis